MSEAVSKKGEEIAFDSNDENGNDDCLLVAEPLRLAATALDENNVDGSTSKPDVRNFLQSVPHLFTLSIEQISGLNVMFREYGAMNVIVEEGAMLEHVYVLASGTVEVMNSKKGLKRAFGHRRIGSITAPNIFGIDDAILEKPADFTYHASTKTTLLLIPKDEFVSLFKKSPIFANNVSGWVLQNLPQFKVFQDFCRAIFGLSSYNEHGADEDGGYRLSLRNIIRSFKMSGTVFHKRANSNIIDGEALSYCVRRLPSNATETYIFILTPTMPEYMSDEFVADVVTNTAYGGRSNVIGVDTGKRRRCAWTFGGGGQTLVMMRDGFTDTIDFVSNLCIFSVECEKIRTKLNQIVSPSAVQILRQGIADQEQGLEVSGVFERLPLLPNEVHAVQRAWGERALQQLCNIMLHREEYVLQMESSLTKRFAQDPYANWALTIERQIKKCLELSEDDDLPESTRIDILFSPNRTLKNLFCSMSDDVRELIENDDVLRESFGKGHSVWENKDDQYYYILTNLLENIEQIRDGYRARLESTGFVLMEDAHASALIVDIIDVSKISCADVDPALREAANAAKKRSQDGERLFIVNVDKTFGAQIEAILRSLLLTFSNHVRGVNLSGKAAGLSGNRGDVIVPSKLLFSKQSFGEDSTDEIRLCNRNLLSLDDVKPLVGKNCALHSSTCITVPGFVLQSLPVLKFYKIVHDCGSVDMQSSYVARQLEECRRTGVFNHVIPSRYIFYFDDMPLGNEDGTKLKPQKREIISTIYASARALLRQVLNPH